MIVASSERLTLLLRCLGLTLCCARPASANLPHRQFSGCHSESQRAALRTVGTGNSMTTLYHVLVIDID